jgi:hypothetical protein
MILGTSDMKIRIIDVEADMSVVSFSTDFGDAVALWNGSIPQPDTIHHVEVEISDTLIWDKNIEQVQKNMCSLGMETGEFFLVGRLESADDEGYSVIRIGDSVVVVIAKGSRPPLGAFVRIRVKAVALYEAKY